MSDVEPRKDLPEETDDLVFETLWGRVLEAWDEDKPHAAALEYAMRAQRLPELAGRYRKLSEDPEKGARAKKKLDALVLAATQMMLAMKTPRMEKMPPAIAWSALFVFMAIAGLLLYALLLRRP